MFPNVLGNTVATLWFIIFIKYIYIYTLSPLSTHAFQLPFPSEKNYPSFKSPISSNLSRSSTSSESSPSKFQISQFSPSHRRPEKKNKKEKVKIKNNILKVYENIKGSVFI